MNYYRAYKDIVNTKGILIESLSIAPENSISIFEHHPLVPHEEPHNNAPNCANNIVPQETSDLSHSRFVHFGQLVGHFSLVFDVLAVLTETYILSKYRVRAHSKSGHVYLEQSNKEIRNSGCP